jgi:Tol biopolymer transport system component
LTAIIRENPEPVGSLAPLSPVALRWIVERCLAKDPDERFLSTRDLALDLANLRDHASEVSSERIAASPAHGRRRRLAPAFAAGLLALAAVVFAVLFASRASRERPGPVMKFQVPVPRGTTYAPPEVSRGLSVSPDGTRMVIEAYSKGRRRLFVRPLDSEEATELEGSLDATAHFWSPDSRFIAFYAAGKLKKIPANGGPAVELCDAPFALVGTWNREGTILFSNFNPPGIFRVSDTGGEAVRVLAPEASRHESFLLWPQFLPDGRRFLYVANTRSPIARRELNVGSLDSKEVRLVANLDSRAEYAAPGYLVYVRDSALFAQPFDEGKARLHGEARLIAPNVHYFYGPTHAAFSVSQTGMLAYQTAAQPVEIVWFDRQGKRAGQIGEPVVVKGLRISPDGKKAAADIEDRRTGTSDVWVTELATGVSTRVHSDPVDENMPVWWPDGTKLLYRSDRGGPPDIYEITLGAPGSERPFLEQPAVQQPEDVSRDGRLLVYVSEEQSALSHIWLMPLQGDRKPFPWSGTRFHETSPRISPDGRWIAFESNESGEPEIYAALTEGAAGKRRISPSGGRLPRWRADGKELYYLAPNGTVMAVAVTLGSNLETGPPAALFRPEPEFRNYDVTADGSKFLATVPLEKTPESPIRVIVNWTDVFGKSP